MPTQHRQVLLRLRELVHRDGQEVVGEVDLDVLVEVVTDPRAVREQVLDRDVVADQRQVVAEEGAGGRHKLEHPVLDQAHDGQRGQRLGRARSSEQRVGRVRDLPRTVREAPRLLQLEPAATIDANGTGEARLRSDGLEGLDELGHDGAR